VEALGIPQSQPQQQDRRSMIDKMQPAAPSVRIAVVGKYVELHDAYMSVKEALLHAAMLVERQLEIEWLHSSDLEKDRGFEILETVNGVVVPGGFGERGVEGKILAARFAREHKIPYLGLCLGMQVMCIEFARNVLAVEDAHSTEFELHADHPVIHLMPDQHGINNLGGTMRLGLYPCSLKPGTVAAQAYQRTHVEERHRHRFEFNNAYRERFSSAGMVFSGVSPDDLLVEIAEISDHPFMLGSQFHPEFQSRPNRPHPLFASFMKASAAYSPSVEVEAASTAEIKGVGNGH
ncbi:MAG: CTP synthase, partial [Chloroflexi bacterium]|nr:CTP synthase [Chloroflexota bacterium]